MTTFNPADMPPAIVTVEQVHAWSGLLLTRINPTLAILEAENFLSM